MSPAPRRRRTAGLLAAGLVGVAALLGAPHALAQGPTSLGQGSVTQPVGLATDHANRRYWAIQGTSGSPSVLGFDEKGDKLGATSSRDRTTNVQALAFSARQLFIGDIGGTRERVTILQMDRPLPGTEINRSITISLVYPDGAHDAAALMADANERLFVVTRGKGAGIYAAPAEVSANAPWVTTSPPPNTLARVADAPPDVTDGTFLVDGRIALRSASQGVSVLDPTTYQVLGTAHLEAPQKGGSLTQSLDQGVLLGDAGPDGRLVAIPIPGPPPAKPTAVATKRPAGQANAPLVEPKENRSIEQTGTVVALVAAVAAALLGAGIVLVKR